MNTDEADDLANWVAGLYGAAVTPAQVRLLRDALLPLDERVAGDVIRDSREHAEEFNLSGLLDAVRAEQIRRTGAGPRLREALAERREADQSWQQVDDAVDGLSDADFSNHADAVFDANPTLRMMLAGKGDPRQSRTLRALIAERLRGGGAGESAAPAAGGFAGRLSGGEDGVSGSGPRVLGGSGRAVAVRPAPVPNVAAAAASFEPGASPSPPPPVGAKAGRKPNRHPRLPGAG